MLYIPLDQMHLESKTTGDKSLKHYLQSYNSFGVL